MGTLDQGTACGVMSRGKKGLCGDGQGRGPENVSTLGEEEGAKGCGMREGRN